jgi:hypothetical protein
VRTPLSLFFLLCPHLSSDWVHREAASRLPGTQISNLVVDDDILAPYWKYEPSVRSEEGHEWDGRRLKVGLVSSDFGVHPVATLLRGMIQFINTSRIELFCFALNDKLSWWGTNISMTAEHFVSLSNMNNQVPLPFLDLSSPCSN